MCCIKDHYSFWYCLVPIYLFLQVAKVYTTLKAFFPDEDMHEQILIYLSARCVHTVLDIDRYVHMIDTPELNAFQQQ